jgi:hypothetical protein
MTRRTLAVCCVLVVFALAAMPVALNAAEEGMAARTHAQQSPLTVIRDGNPIQFNYQMMLTDDADNALADQELELGFALYDQAEGGTMVWSEIQNATTNSIGVVSVALGTVNPISFYTFGPMWLQVTVNGEPLDPRRQFQWSPYSVTAMEAYHAADTDYLGGVSFDSYAQYDDLSTPGTVNNPGNPLEWTKLKSVPDGFSDGIDNAGEGDGNSLDAPDGDPTDAIWVDADGRVLVGDDYVIGSFAVEALPERVGGYFWSDSDNVLNVGAIVSSDSTSGLVGNTGNAATSYTVPVTESGIGGVATNNGNGGSFFALGEGTGVYTTSSGAGSAIQAVAGGMGYSGDFSGGSGIRIRRSSGYPVVDVISDVTSGFGDALRVASGSGVSSATWTLRSYCYQGSAGYLQKSIDDNAYAVQIYGASSSSEGLYVSGTIVSTAPVARTVQTSRGKEAVFGVSAADADVIASGTGRLNGGTARVDFDRLFAESITGPDGLRITATPIGVWSALYVERIDAGGFDLRSASGDAGAEFHWVAVGRAAGDGRSHDVTIPDDDATRALAQEKEREVERLRPPDVEQPGVAAFSR